MAAPISAEQAGVTASADYLGAAFGVPNGYARAAAHGREF